MPGVRDVHGGYAVSFFGVHWGMLTKLGSAKADLGASKEVLILSAQISEQKQINANTNDGTVGWERVRKE